MKVYEWAKKESRLFIGITIGLGFYKIIDELTTIITTAIIKRLLVDVIQPLIDGDGNRTLTVNVTDITNLL